MATTNPKEITKALEKRLKEIAESQVLIGVPEDKEAEEEGVFLADIAFINNFGSKTRNIPARPFGTTAVPRYKKEINKFVRQQLALATEGKQGVQRSYDRIGQVAAGYMRKNLTDGGWEENKESTIRAKGSSQPLINQGTLRQGITWIVKKEE